MSAITTSVTSSTSVTTPSDTEVVITRSIAGPRRLIYEAWTSCDHLPNWMGAEGWPMTECEIDLRVGGSYRYVSTGPDGVVLELRGTYTEISRPDRLVSRGSWGCDWPETLDTLDLTEADGFTTIRLTMRYPSKEARDAAMATGMVEGMNAGYDRLTEYVRSIG
jgi:uncharacterized protein YndB with AHSA1/START domain